MVGIPTSQNIIKNVWHAETGSGKECSIENGHSRHHIYQKNPALTYGSTAILF
jgi:hypothetical protein